MAKPTSKWEHDAIIPLCSTYVGVAVKSVEIETELPLVVMPAMCL